MTPVTTILMQRANLCRSALLRTSDVNEAYLAVHSVIAHALSRAGNPRCDLERDLTSALNRRAAVLGGAG